MEQNVKYYVVKDKAVPEVLIKVVEAKRLLTADKMMTVKEATDKCGISRSSFYKYKDDIFPFDDSSKGRNITLSIQISDEPGLLSELLAVVAKYHANIDNTSNYTGKRCGNYFFVYRDFEGYRRLV